MLVSDYVNAELQQQWNEFGRATFYPSCTRNCIPMLYVQVKSTKCAATCIPEDGDWHLAKEGFAVKNLTGTDKVSSFECTG